MGRSLTASSPTAATPRVATSLKCWGGSSQAPGQRGSGSIRCQNRERRGDSLARLLERERGHRHLLHRPDLSEAQIVAWAWAHRRRTGWWPTHNSGPVTEVLGEKWGPSTRH